LAFGILRLGFVVQIWDFRVRLGFEIGPSLIRTDTLSATDFKILSTKGIEVTTLTFQGHMTSTIT